MKEFKNQLKRYQLSMIAGLLILPISSYFYFSGLISHDDRFSRSFQDGGAVVVIGILTAILALMCLINILKYPKNERNVPRILVVMLIFQLTLASLSLNESVKVFAPFHPNMSLTVWLSALGLLLSAIPISDKRWYKAIVSILLGIGLVLNFYLVLFLLPILPLCIFGIIFFGFGILGFTPVWWLWYILSFITKEKSKQNSRFLIAGLCLPIISLGFYLYQWKAVHQDLKALHANYQMNLETQNIPFVYKAAQQLKTGTIAGDVLSAQFSAQQFLSHYEHFGRFGDREVMYHHPFHAIANLVFTPLSLSLNEASQLIRIRDKFRHEDIPRLWQGDQLATTIISTRIIAHPEYRVAYIEKKLNIHHQKLENRFWRNNSQEAIYSFKIPEGGTVTSLSLWVNGKEEKSRLTTKRKADSAYTSIVGIERRDPAIVHWMEGNQVSLKVFPCTPEEDRIVKIGFTVPMKHNNNELSISNVELTGTDLNHATEELSLNSSLPLSFTSVPKRFDVNSSKTVSYKGQFQNEWKISFKDPGMSQDGFMHDGAIYQVQHSLNQLKKLTPQTAYLDLNKHWQLDEIEQLIKQFPQTEFYLTSPEHERINAKNFKEKCEDALSYHFSVFDFSKVRHADQSIIFTKSSAFGPYFNDLQGSAYFETNRPFLSKRESPLQVIQLDNADPSPLFKTLADLHLLSIQKSDIETITKKGIQIQEDHFVSNDSLQYIKEAKMLISKTILAHPNSKASKQAPSHLMRLFLYGQLMQELGSDYFNPEFNQNTFIEKAENAYIVTPFSSLVVLETQSDYDNHGISKNKNTLGNVDAQQEMFKLSGGDVPEPHEWALIILFSAWLVRLLWLRKFRFQTK